MDATSRKRILCKPKSFGFHDRKQNFYLCPEKRVEALESNEAVPDAKLALGDAE